MITKSVIFILVFSQIQSSCALKDADISRLRKVRQIEPLDEERQNSRQVIQPMSNSLDKNESSTNKPTILTVSSKIPVAVTNNLNENLSQSNKISNTTENKVKKRKRARRPNQLKNDSTKEKLQKPEDFSIVNLSTSTTERATTSQGPRTIVPKVFTKRPPEDNPVFKNVRQRDPVVKILQESNYVFAHNGNFRYSFEGADGTKVSSNGELKSFNDDKTGEAVVGSVSYKDNEGNDFNLSYTADENGYRPQGAHLPTPPPIPPAIARALAYLATKTTPQPVTEPIT